jgi:hypothetical protein
LSEPFLNALEPITVEEKLSLDPPSEVVDPLGNLLVLDGVGRCGGIYPRPSPAAFKCSV